MNPHLLAFLEATAVVAVLCLAASAVLGLAVVIVGRLPAVDEGERVEGR